MSKKIYNKIEKSFDKYSDQYCLIMFKAMLNNVVKWKSLKKYLNIKENLNIIINI